MVTIYVPVVYLDLYHSPSIAFAECFEGKSEGFLVGVDIVLDDLGPVDYGEGAVFIGFADGEERITSPKPKPIFSVQLQATEVEFENLSAGENLLGDYCDGLLRVIGRRSSASHSNHPSGQASSLCRDDLPKTAFAGTEEVMVLDFDGFAIAIIHVELEHLPRLKLVTHFELGLPGRVNGVHDCFI